MMHILVTEAGTLASISPTLADWILLITVLVASTLIDSILYRYCEVSTRWSVIQFLAGVVVAFGFGAYLLWRFGLTPATEYLTAYPLELSLSFDNVFAWELLLAGLCAPRSLHGALLNWAIVLAIVLRAIFLWIGVVALQAIAFTELVFGAFLLITAYTMARRLGSQEEGEGQRGQLTYRVLSKLLPLTDTWHGMRPLVREQGSVKVTPVVLTIACIGAADAVFAFDSGPAVLGVTHQPYLVLGSVMMAVIGLKSLFFIYRLIKTRFPRVEVMLVGIVGLIGVKLLLAYFGLSLPGGLVLLLVLALLGAGVIWSATERKQQLLRG